MGGIPDTATPARIGNRVPAGNLESLVIEIILLVYPINNPDFNAYMEVQQQFNFQIFERVGEMGSFHSLPHPDIVP
ncbi:hypothetical protein [Lunatibacter salilacus]|uniref:hypothetical protein n=1 Tax=Lunatibacter salilacus TaxID=2483804 RepID=UPI00131C1B50|nr:hypothetical protein [Lunatibacter salilacus]